MAKGETGMQLGCLVPALTGPPGLEGPILAPISFKSSVSLDFPPQGRHHFSDHHSAELRENIYYPQYLGPSHVSESPSQRQVSGGGGGETLFLFGSPFFPWQDATFSEAFPTAKLFDNRPKISPKRWIRALTRADLFTNAEAWGLE